MPSFWRLVRERVERACDSSLKTSPRNPFSQWSIRPAVRPLPDANERGIMVTSRWERFLVRFGKVREGKHLSQVDGADGKAWFEPVLADARRGEGLRAAARA